MAKKHSKKNTDSFNYPDLKNSFNTLLANIRFASIDKPLKSLSIISVGMDEGKSTVASNLALAIANSGKTCLIIEGDMRKRSLAKMMKISPKFGLYSLLTGGCTINDAIVNTEFRNLYFLDCEPNIPNPSDILSTKRFAALVDYLYEKYDYIIFDTPPLISFVDGAMISSLVDACVVVVREGNAKKAEVKNAITQLKQANANILGTVLTFSADTTESDYYYAYYNKEGKRVSKRDKNATDSSNLKVSNTQSQQNLSTWFNNSGNGKASIKQKSMVDAAYVAPDTTGPIDPKELTKEYFKNAKHHFANTDND